MFSNINKSCLKIIQIKMKLINSLLNVNKLLISYFTYRNKKKYRMKFYHLCPCFRETRLNIYDHEIDQFSNSNFEN